jgi:DNA-directed RNA polymerase subunit RPC12/RpoP
MPAREVSQEFVCPHCKKTFMAELIVGDAQRYRGFKCPHCKLFVPADRAGKRQPPAPQRV